MLSPIPPPSALIAAVVRYDRVASPVSRLQMLAPLFDSRPSPFEMRDADQGRIGRVARGHQVRPVTLVPAERRDPVVVAVQDPGLAPRGHRRQDRLPARQLVAAVADHAGQGVDRAGAHPAGEDGMGEAVDLDDHEAGLVRVALRALDQQSLDEHAVVGAAAVDAEDPGQDGVDDRVDERADQRDQEPVDMDAWAPTARRPGTSPPGGRGRGPRSGPARSAPRARAPRVGRPR